MLLGLGSEKQAEEPLAGAPRELGQVREKGNHLLSTNYVPGTQATAGIHLFLVAVLKARAYFQKGRGHRDS